MTTDALSWLELSRSALLHNLVAARALAGSARLIPVLKANSYGAGAVGMAQTIATAGVAAFAVATVSGCSKIQPSRATCRPHLLSGLHAFLILLSNHV